MVSLESARTGLTGSALAIVVLLVAGVATGCGGSGAGSAGNAPVVNVSERDFAINAPKTLPAGEVVLRVHNNGPVAHELIVVRASSADLPMRSDGLTVNENRLARREAGALEPADAHAVRELRLHLTPGRYVLFCNMSGHFMGGMHRVLVVS